MKHTSLLWITASLTAVVLVFVAAVRAEAEVTGADSIEWRVADADAIIRASVIRVDVENGVHGQFIENATLKANETLKGTGPKHLKHSVRLSTARGWEKFDRPSRWKQGAVELLVFVKNGKIKSLLRLDGKKAHGQGYRAFTLDMKVCKTKNSILAAVYGALEFGEKDKPIGGIMIEVPFGAEFWSELWGGSSVFLSVPLDSRLEGAVKRWSSSNDGLLKEQVPRILKAIEKAKNSRNPRGTPVNPVSN